MSMTAYAGRRLEILATVTDRSSGSPASVTGGVVAVAQRADEIVGAQVEISGTQITALFDGTLTGLGAWLLQITEDRGGDVPEVLYSDQIIVVPSITIAGFPPVIPA